MSCCEYLIFNQKILIYTTNIKKVIAKPNLFVLRSKTLINNNRSEITRRSEISLDTGTFFKKTAIPLTFRG